MISENTREWIEIAGIFGVMISLVFVGVQLKQAQDIARSDAYHDRAELSIALRMAPLQSPMLLSALTKRSQGEELSDEERRAVNQYINIQLIYIENVHHQYEAGFIPEDQWESNFNALKNILTDPVQRRRILKARHAASAPYYRQIERAIAELEVE